MPEVYGRIYLITCSVNGKVYVGQTISTIEKRLKRHFYLSKHSDCYIHRAILQYGQENFFIKEIDTAHSIDELNEKEKKYIMEYDSFNSEIGYNLTLGGEGGSQNSETRKKMSESHKGKPSPMMGKHHSNETKKLLSEVCKGEKHHMYGKTGKYHYSSMRVICIETGEEFDCIRDIERKYGLANSGISRCCRGIRQTCGGYHWKFI